MAEVILMPRLSDTMTEGVIASWQKNVGDTVQKGDVLAEIETDKATMDLESYKDGVILHLGGEKGSKIEVNQLLAIIGEKGEDVSKLVAEHSGGGQSTADSQPTTDKSEEKQSTEKKEAQPTTNNQPSTSNVDTSDAVLMPRLSDTMTEGVIASWQKNVGDDVKKGDVLAEIETDKATMDLESYKDGKLLFQGAKAGEKVAVNDLLCIIGKDGTDVDAIVNAVKGGNQSTDESQKSQKSEKSEDKKTTDDNKQSTEKKEAQPTTNEQQTQQVVNEGRIFASPLAKKLAEEKNIDLKYVKGSGDNGRITKADIENYTPQQATTTPAVQTAAPAATQAATGEAYKEVPVSQMRKVIAKRLSESLFTAPHFYLTMKIDMDAAVAARKVINENAAVKISFNDLVLKATAIALTQHPAVNSSWLGDKIRYNNHINIGVAVAVEDGLLVPVVRNANNKSLAQIGKEVKEYAQKAKDKKLQPSDWEGNTFTISNLGMFGIDEFTAIINPPDACILAVGGISQEPVVKNGQIVPGNIMKVTLSCDHRVVDGATGAAFLQTLKSLLEEPLRMLV